MTITKEVLDELLEGVERPEDLLGDAGLMKELKVRLMQRMLGAELTAHLRYEEGQSAPLGLSNRCNESTTKVLKGQDGELPLAVPRKRDSSFEPELVKKGQTRIDGLEDKITCPLLVVQAAAEGEEIVTTAREFFDKLPNPKNKFRLTTEEEGAEMHCQKGNAMLLHAIEFDWLDDVFA